MDPEPLSDDRQSAVDDRRRNTRFLTDCPVELVLDVTRFEGGAQNISSDGISFFADGPLTVQVRVGRGEHASRLVGRVVRMESVDARRMALAIRFEEPLDLASIPLEP